MFKPTDKPIAKKLRYLPILGIAFILIGYLFVALQIKNLESKKGRLIAEIAQLEKTKTILTIGTKEKDEIIVRQHEVITESSDKETKQQGEELNKALQNSTIFKTLVNPSTEGIDSAKVMERKGYEALFNKDIKNAIQYFKDCENSYNGYHQVYEIAFYLNGNQNKLMTTDEKAWKETYGKILSDFSWRMPADIKSKLAQKSK